MGVVKVTLTLPEELLAVVDRYVAESPGTTRSGVCATALREWLRDQQEGEIERYYRTMSDEERSEDAAWSSLAARGIDRLWR